MIKVKMLKKNTIVYFDGKVYHSAPPKGKKCQVIKLIDAYTPPISYIDECRDTDDYDDPNCMVYAAQKWGVENLTKGTFETVIIKSIIGKWFIVYGTRVGKIISDPCDDTNFKKEKHVV